MPIFLPPSAAGGGSGITTPTETTLNGVVLFNSTDGVVLKDGGTLGDAAFGQIGSTVAAASHTHAQSDVTNLVTDLAGKSDVGHTHAQSDVTGLATSLAGKSDVGHTHAQSDVTGLATSLSNKSDVGHTHAQSDVTGLTTSLAGKSDTTHTHDLSGSTVTNVLPVSKGGTNQTTLSAGAQAFLDSISSTQGAILYRGASSWAVLGTGTSGQLLKTQGAGANPVWVSPAVEICIAISDETTALTTGTNKVVFRMPFAMNVSAVRASAATAPTGSALIFDIKETGTSILSTLLSIDASAKTSTTSTTPAVLSDTALADDAEVSISITQIGASVAGAGAKIYIIGTRA